MSSITKRRLPNVQPSNSHSSVKDSTIVREQTKSIREDLKYQYEKEKTFSSSSIHRRIKDDHIHAENEYLIQQQTHLAKSTVLNEMLSFKKELEKSERRCEQISHQYESAMKTINEKEKIISKRSNELKEITENYETLERQNSKLQHDLTLALEKLEEMTEEAERFAEESLNSQKQLADSEQKREESHIQSQETIKQWNARVKKLEKDLERYKLESTQLTEKHEELTQENQTLKSRYSILKDENTKIQTDFNEIKIKSKQLEEHSEQIQSNVIHLRSIESSQKIENSTLKGTINELENQLSVLRQRLAQNEKEKEDVQESYEEEIKHRHQIYLQFKQSEENIEALNTSYIQLQRDYSEKFKDLQSEKDLLHHEKNKSLSLQTEYEEFKNKFEITQTEYTRRLKALQLDYENKLETIQMELSEKKSQITILQRHQTEDQREIERLREKADRYEDENIDKQSTIETLSRDNSDKSRWNDELQSKLNRSTVELTNVKNEMIRKDHDHLNFLRKYYEDILFCTECLSTDPFLIESTTPPRDDIELYSSKLKAHLSWLKQELEVHHDQERKLKEELNSVRMDCENDRKYLTSELEKREEFIQQLTNTHQQPERDYSDFDTSKFSIEDKTDRIDQRYRQFQIMVDSVKRELHSAKIELLN